MYDIDFIYVWEIVNELFDKYEINSVDEAINNTELLEELEATERAFLEMLGVQ